MTWVKQVPVERRPPVCIHIGLLGAILTMSSMGVGSRWVCDQCGATWMVVSDGPGGPRRLERAAR